MKQEITSKNTSVNIIPKLFKTKWFSEKVSNSIGVLDYGGGKYDTATKYVMDTYGVSMRVCDIYNRSIEHNNYAIHQPRDIITCCNVLNIIQEIEIIKDLLMYVKALGCNCNTIFIQIYEGDKSGQGKPTTKGYQRNQKTKEYLPLIEEIFKGKCYTISVKSNIIMIDIERGK